MSVSVAEDIERVSLIADALRAQWRMVDWVELTASGDGQGYEATIHLDTTIAQAAAEQQGTNHSPRLMLVAESRRAKAMRECVERVNATLPRAEQIRTFQMVGP